jgi:ArsR family transcriptional regulator
MNLISHHLKVLRSAGLVNIARNPDDARWIYYSLNVGKVAELRNLIGAFLGKQISTLAPDCGPTKARVKHHLLSAG